ncbi:MAG: hypothetical protein ACD_56C00097G0006 [uncultured bacterium]|nr:MAG: hypothetical protein ACD_56C00097G0006 [uncultured bacterium]
MEILLNNPWIIILILIWTLPWKGAALWKAARNGQIGWFLTLIVFNTLAVLDIIYIFFFSNPAIKESNSNQDEVRQARMQRYREQQAKKRALEKQVEQQHDLSVRQSESLVATKRRPNVI